MKDCRAYNSYLQHCTSSVQLPHFQVHEWQGKIYSSFSKRDSTATTVRIQ
jgi:hypothetical protein